MDIGNAKVAAGIGINLFSELLKEIQKKRLNGSQNIHNSDIEIIPGVTVNAKANLSLAPVNFNLHKDNSGDLYTRLDISGSVEIIIDTDQIDPTKILTIPINASLRIGFTLKDKPNAAPVIGLVYDGVESVQSPLTEEQINTMLEERGFLEILEDIELDVLTPAFDAMNNLYYNGDGANYSEWPCEMKLLEHQPGYVNAVAIFLGLPGESLNINNLKSFVPISSEIALIINKSLIDNVLSKIRQEIIDSIKAADDELTVLGIDVIDIDIDSSILEMRNNSIYIDFDLKSIAADAYVRGDIVPNLIPGSTAIGMYTGGLDENIDLCWLLDLIKPFWDELDDAVDGAPRMLHSLLNEQMRSITAKIGEELNLSDFSIYNVPVDVYPNNCKVENGNIGLFTQVIIETIMEPIVNGSYSKMRDRFIYFELESGRLFQNKHLAQFVKKGRIVTPGFHDVEGEYMRSNPDNTEGNNLLTQYQR